MLNTVDNALSPQRAAQAKARILYIHQDGLLSGSAISLRNLLLALDRSRFQPRVLLAQDGPVRRLYEELGIEVDVVPACALWTFPGAHWYQRGYYHGWKALLPNKQLEDYLRRIRPDLVHINDKAMLTAGLAARRVGLPVVWHLRSSYNVTYSRAQANVSRLLIRRIASRLIAISEDEVDGFEDLDKLQIIYNSVDFAAAVEAGTKRAAIRRELGLSDDEIAVGMVGTLSAMKGAWDFISAAGLVRRREPTRKFRFIIVAAIPDREPRQLGLWERLRPAQALHPEDQAWHLAREAGIAGQLILTGYRQDVLAVMSAMEMVVVCTRLGVIGRPPFEAMAIGRPVIVTAGHSGRTGVVRDNETALVVPPADVEALSKAIIKLSCDPKLRQQMGESGAEYARMHFAPHKNIQAVQHVYEELLKEQARHVA